MGFGIFFCFTQIHLGPCFQGKQISMFFLIFLELFEYWDTLGVPEQVEKIIVFFSTSFYRSGAVLLIDTFSLEKIFFCFCWNLKSSRGDFTLHQISSYEYGVNLCARVKEAECIKLSFYKHFSLDSRVTTTAQNESIRHQTWRRVNLSLIIMTPSTVETAFSSRYKIIYPN